MYAGAIKVAGTTEYEVQERKGNDLVEFQRFMKEPLVMGQLCLRTSQEKAIKAILVNAGLDVPRSHNIGALLELLPERIVVPDGVAAATELTDYAVEARYPGAFEAVTDEEYSRALVLASAVVRWSDEQVSGTATG